MSLHKIHTRIVIDSMTGKVEEDEFYWHDTDKDGPISQLGGGGGGDGADGDFDEAAMEAEAVAGSTVGGAGSGGPDGGGGHAVADFTGPGPTGSPGTGGPVGSAGGRTDAEGGGPPGMGGGHPDHGVSGVAESGAAGSGMESHAGGAASAGLAGTSGGGATSDFGDYGGTMSGIIDPTWGWDPDSAATYGYGHGLTPTGLITGWSPPGDDDEPIDGGGEPPEGEPPGGGPGAGVPGPGVGAPPGAPGTVAPPWWSGTPHAVYEWGRYGTPYEIPATRWAGEGDVPAHLTGYMPHFEGILADQYVYPTINSYGLLFGTTPPAMTSEDDDDDEGEEEESGGEGGEPVE